MWDHLIRQPENLSLGYRDKLTFVDTCSPTDEAGYTFFTDGMKRRLGDHPKPSAVLLLDHIVWLEGYFERLYLECPVDQPEARIRQARAALALIIAYSGWLRATETFGIRWGDVEVVEPASGPTLGLPLGIGAILLKLLEQTKSNQFSRADMEIAYTTASGLSAGKWYQRLYDLLPPDARQPRQFLFAHDDGRAWTSHYFRHHHFYPALFVKRELGDQYLSRFDDLRAIFWGFNTMRRTGRSVAWKKRAQTIRKAAPSEVVEHGRWKIQRSTLDMPAAYLETDVPDRICITQLCL
jgi:hypothetical protein